MWKLNNTGVKPFKGDFFWICTTNRALSIKLQACQVIGSCLAQSSVELSDMHTKIITYIYCNLLAWCYCSCVSSSGNRTECQYFRKCVWITLQPLSEHVKFYIMWQTKWEKTIVDCIHWERLTQKCIDIFTQSSGASLENPISHSTSCRTPTTNKQLGEWAVTRCCSIPLPLSSVFREH